MSWEKLFIIYLSVVRVPAKYEELHSWIKRSKRENIQGRNKSPNSSLSKIHWILQLHLTGEKGVEVPQIHNIYPYHHLLKYLQSEESLSRVRPREKTPPK